VHNEELNKFATHHILLGVHIKNVEKAVASMRAKYCVSRFSLGKSKKKRRFGNCRFGWDLGSQDGEWINLARRRGKGFQKL
jgi:hypothetical protein